MSTTQEELAFKIKPLLLPDLESVLDLGCGNCHVTRYVINHIPKRVGIDLNESLVEEAQEFLTEACIMDMRKALLHLGGKSFDLVIMIDTLEHIHKLDGLKLLKDVEEIAKKQIVLFVPDGDLSWRMKDEKDSLQKHRATWCEEDFKKLQYKVRRLEKFHIENDALICWKDVGEKEMR